MMDGVHFALTALLIVVTCCLLAMSTFVYIRRKYSNLPSPKMSSFFFGHYLDVLRERQKKGGENPPDGLLLKWASEVGNLYIVFFIHKPILVVLNPQDIETIHMKREHSKPKNVATVTGEIFGQRAALRGLFTLQDYETWHLRRKLYDPAFSKSYLKQTLLMFNECVEQSLNSLKPFADGTSLIPMKRRILEFSHSTIGKIKDDWKNQSMLRCYYKEVAFTSDFSHECEIVSHRSKDRNKLDMSSLVTAMLKAFQEKTYNSNFKILHPFETERYCKAVRMLREIGKECIQKRIKEVNDGREVPNDILSFMLKSAISDEAADIETLLDDFVTFYSAGHETSSNVLSFAMILVHQHPEVLERLLAEIDEVLGSRTSVTAEDLEKLKYTEQVLNETMRLCSPIGFLVVAKESPPGGIALSGHHIPAGTLMTTQASCVHLMAEYFENPTAFSPSRFDPENKKPSPFVFFPFGVGHRACIGKHFAMVEMKLMLCRLIQTYEITLPADYKLHIVERFTRQPNDDIMCTLLPRK